MNDSSPKRRVYRSKVRKITACLECYRRKQKLECDRKQPCNICSSRGVPEKCSYEHQPEYVFQATVLTNRGNEVRISFCATWKDKCILEAMIFKFRVHIREDSLSESLESRSPTIDDVGEDSLSDLSNRIGYNVTAGKSGHALAELQQFPSLEIAQRRGLRQRMGNLPRLSQQRQRQYQRLLHELPSFEAIQHLVNAFFDEANWYFCVLDQFYFDEALRKWTQTYSQNKNSDLLQALETPDELYFPALLFQVLAMALQFIPPEMAEQPSIKQLASPSFDDRSAIFSNAGETIMSLLGRRSGDNKTAVEADIMRAAWLKNSGSGLDAYYALGNAIRQAQDSTLHLESEEPDPGTTDPMELAELWRHEHRRRIWACLFTWEGHMALQLGRPRMINAADCTIRAPMDTDIPTHPSRTLFRPVGSPDEVPSRFTAQLIKYELARLIHRLMSLGAFTSTFTDYRTILAAHVEAEELFRSLPPALQMTDNGPLDDRWDLQYPTVIRHRLHIPIIINSFLLALHRPHITTQPASLTAALKAAKAVLDMSDDLFKITAKHQHKTYTLVFYTIDAGLLLTVIMLQRNRTYAERMSQEEWESICKTLRKAVVRLRILKENNNAAATGEAVLQRCYDKILQTGSVGSTPSEQIQASLDYQYPSVDTVLSGSTVVDGESELNASLESFFDFEMLNDFMNNSAFTANWLDQYTGFEYSDAMMMDMTGQINDQGDSWNSNPY